MILWPYLEGHVARGGTPVAPLPEGPAGGPGAPRRDAGAGAEGETVPAEEMDTAVRLIPPLSLVAVHRAFPAPFDRPWRRWQLQLLLQQCLHLQQNTRAAAATIRDSPPSSPRARVRAHCDSLRGSPPALPLRFRSVHPRALIAVRPGRGRGVDTGQRAEIALYQMQVGTGMQCKQTLASVLPSRRRTAKHDNSISMLE